MNRAGWVVVGASVWAVCGAASARPPTVLELGEEATPDVRAAAARLLDGAGVGESPPVPPAPVATLGPPADAAAVAAALRDGDAAFYAIELDEARARLREAYDALRADPRLWTDEAVGVDRAAAGLLTLARVELHAGHDDDATAVMTWLLGVAPRVAVTEETQPADVVALAERVRGAAAAGQLAWSAPGAGSCRLLVWGVDRGADSPVPVPPGPTIVWVRCGGADGWPRRVDVPAGGVVTLSLAPAAEVSLRWEGGALVPLGALGPGARVEAASAAADALGAPVVVPVAGPGVLRLVLVEPAAAPRTLAEELLDAAPEPPGVPAAERSSLAPWGWSVLGVGAGLVVGGGGLHAAHDARVGGAPTRDDLDDVRQLHDASIGLYAAGGAALVAGIVVLVVDAVSGPEPTAELASPPPGVAGRSPRDPAWGAMSGVGGAKPAP